MSTCIYDKNEYPLYYEDIDDNGKYFRIHTYTIHGSQHETYINGVFIRSDYNSYTRI